MTCAHEKKYLDAYLDGELEAGLMIEVEAHLDGCESCAAMYSLKKRMKTEIAAIGDSVRAPEHLRRRIEALPGKRRRRAIIAAITATPLAAAAAVMLVLAIGDPASDGAPISAVVDEVAMRHARELPMEVRGPDPGLAESWFRGKVDFPVRAPHLGVKNASFQGARLSNVEARQAAHMVYEVEGHRVTLMIFPARELSVRGADVVRAGGRDVLLGRRNGYNVAVMLDGDMAYAVSSDLPSERLLAILTDPRI